jgi:hypothetical protein
MSMINSADIHPTEVERLKAELAALPKKSPEPFTFQWGKVRKSLGTLPAAAP